jgi:hypothetical protein
VKLPPSNAALKTEALPAYRFLGRTTIVLNGASMTVTGKRENGTTLTNQTMAVPRDGLIYVSNDAGCPEPGYDPLNPYPATQPCGNVWLSGSYSRSLTIASENDVVFNGNVTRSGDVLLGVIPDDWARVHHPTTGCTASGGGTNAAGTMQDVTIQAAILTVKHSFTVDSFWCGASLGTLTVDGAIGQKHRGPVGTSGGGNYTGYTKNYTYDDRLRYRSPPKFLDPVQSAWRLKSQVEQVPANATPEAT